jgi:hypothetical protein
MQSFFGDFEAAAAQVDVLFVARRTGWLEDSFAQRIKNESAFPFRLNEASALQDF